MDQTTSLINNQRTTDNKICMLLLLCICFITTIIIYLTYEIKSLIDNFNYTNKCQNNYIWYINLTSIIINIFGTCLCWDFSCGLINSDIFRYIKQNINNEFFDSIDVEENNDINVEENNVPKNIRYFYMLYLLTSIILSIYYIINNNCNEIRETSLWIFFIIELSFDSLNLLTLSFFMILKS